MIENDTLKFWAVSNNKTSAVLYKPFFLSRCTIIFSVTKDVVALINAVIAVLTAATCSSPSLSGIVATPYTYIHSVICMY